MMKFMLHELAAAIRYVRQDRLDPCFKILARVKQIQFQMFEQWSVLETLTPSEYMQFRHVLGHASGFQSPQYRTLAFLLGNKNAALIEVFRHDPAVYADLEAALHAPSLSLRDIDINGYTRRAPVPCGRKRKDAGCSIKEARPGSPSQAACGSAPGWCRWRFGRVSRRSVPSPP
jgi:tryptophan 2,3-dioxygenase